MDDSIPPEGGVNGSATPGAISSTIWMQSDQLDRPDVTHRYLAKPDAFVFAVEARRRGSE